MDAVAKRASTAELDQPGPVSSVSAARTLQEVLDWDDRERQDPGSESYFVIDGSFGFSLTTGFVDRCELASETVIEWTNTYTILHLIANTTRSHLGNKQ